MNADEFFSPANRKSETLRKLSPAQIAELEQIAAKGVDLSDDDDE